MRPLALIAALSASGLAMLAAGDAGRRAAEPRDIRASSFAASGMVGEGIAVDTTWPVGPEEAFALFTSSDAWHDRFDLHTRIELAVGGPFELLFGAGAEPPAPEGSQGSEGCQILSYVPGEMLSFSWNAPPAFEERAEHTWVVITFAPGESENTTNLRLRHVGFGEGGRWAEVEAYFGNAWPRLLGAMGDDLTD